MASAANGFLAWPGYLVLESFRHGNAAPKALKFMTPARLYVYDTILNRLAYNFKHIAFELGPFV